ncbi:MAG: MerR family transcriptional regulator [Bulleidia sp.]
MSRSIGEISRLYNIPVSTLRYYDSEGLFPDMQRKSGIRIFTKKEEDQLRMIECLKKTGLEIREIRQFMEWTRQGSETYENRRDLLYRQKEHVQKQIEEMEKVMAMIRFKCWYYDTAIENGNEETLKSMTPDDYPQEIRKLYDLSRR